MPHASLPPSRILALVVTLVALAFAGCLGDGDAKETPQGTVDTPDVPTPDDGEIDWTDRNVTPPVNENVPEAHYHHYWGNPPLPDVTIFDGPVTLSVDSCFDSDSDAPTTCVGPEPHLGNVVFGLEDDGDQVPENSRNPHEGGHADTVFTGASRIEATFTWSDNALGSSLLLYYKPANNPDYFPREGGIRITKDDPKAVIEVKPAMSDPAHQFRVSRWSFALVAGSGPVDPWSGPAYLGTGEVSVNMIAVNGGKDNIDPPHPDQWGGQQVLRFNKVEGSFSVTSAHAENGEVEQTVVQGDDHEEIALPLRAVIPTGADKLIVKVFVNATDEASKNLDWGFKWHGANTQTYTVADAFEAQDGARVYTIPIDDYVVDPPYESQSFFRFGFFPVAGDQAQTGTYAGEYAMFVEAHKAPDFTYYF